MFFLLTLTQTTSRLTKCTQQHRVTPNCKDTSGTISRSLAETPEARRASLRSQQVPARNLNIHASTTGHEREGFEAHKASYLRHLQKGRHRRHLRNPVFIFKAFKIRSDQFYFIASVIFLCSISFSSQFFKCKVFIANNLKQCVDN